MTVQAPELERAVAVGRVDHRSVRLWLRSPGGGPHVLELWREGDPGSPRRFSFFVPPAPERDHAARLIFPDEVPGAEPLSPLTRYRVRISREDGAPVGEGRFWTAPASPAQTPERLAVGLASCHQPFDEDGSLRRSGLGMLRAARGAWEQHDVRFVLWVGDQLYADYPLSQSLFRPEVFRAVGPPGRGGLLDCDEAEVRGLYQQRYRRFFGIPEWQALQAEFPGYPILDDHEVVDNFGSMPEHHTARWRNLRAGAGAAYRDYQHLRVAEDPQDRDGPYDYGFDYGAVSTWVLDVRSMRRSKDEDEAKVFAPHQLERFRAWLDAHADARVLLVVVSVPPFFMPAFITTLAARIPSQFRHDAQDRWMEPRYDQDRRALLELIRAHQVKHPEQRVVLMCGDVHVGYAMRCDWRSTPETELYQLTSSAITHQQSRMNWRLERLLPRTHFWLHRPDGPDARIHLLGGRSARFHQPEGRLNVGVLEIDLAQRPARLGFLLYGESAARPGSAERLFESWT